jgi:hypothetical protein
MTWLIVLAIALPTVLAAVALGLWWLLRPRPVSFYDTSPVPELRGGRDPDWAMLRLTPPAEVPPVRVLDAADHATELPLPVVLGENGLKGAILDFGLNLSGRLALDLEDPASGHPVQVGLGESLKLLETQGDALSSLPWQRFRPDLPPVPAEPGPLLTGPHYGFRYALVTPRNGPVCLNAAHVQSEIAAAVRPGKPYPGNFRCSDPLLTRIWYAGVYTVELCTLGQPRAFLDGAKRDRLVWTGDLWAAGLVSYVSSADTLAVRNSLSLLASLQHRDGYIPPTANPVPGQADLLANLVHTALRFTEYVCWWAITLHDYYWHTADREFAQAMFPALETALAWLRRKANPRDGLIRVTKRRAGNWHPPELPTGVLTPVNCLAAWALRDAATLARELGMNGQAEPWLAWRKQLVQALNQQLWHDERGAYLLGDRHPYVVQDANAAAVLAGVAGPGRSQQAMAYLAERLRSPFGPLTAEEPTPAMDSYVSPFASFHELLARASLEDTPELLDMIRTCWGYMVQTDPAATFWEKMSPEGRPQPYPGRPASQTSLAHAWSAGPTYVLSSAILGVRPLAAGYARVSIAPQVEDVQSIVGEVLSWAEGTVPTPQGGIRVRWERPHAIHCRLEVQIPPGVTADVRFPLAAERLITEEGTPALADGSDEGRPCFAGLEAGTYSWSTPGM